MSSKSEIIASLPWRFETDKISIHSTLMRTLVELEHERLCAIRWTQIRRVKTVKFRGKLVEIERWVDVLNVDVAAARSERVKTPHAKRANKNLTREGTRIAMAEAA